jgi:hypothetical protein
MELWLYMLLFLLSWPGVALYVVLWECTDVQCASAFDAIGAQHAASLCNL